MDSQELKRRGGDDDAAAAEKEKKNANDRDKQREKKRSMAKGGLKSLAVALLAPVLITLFATYFLGSGDGDGNGYGYGWRAKPSWVPPLWTLQVMCIVSSFLMGLAAWLVWVDGGFHRKPVALYLYVAQIALGLAWDPVVFRVGAGWVGLALRLGESAALFGCYKAFKGINPIAGDLVKPCLAWAAFAGAVNLKLAMV